MKVKTIFLFFRQIKLSGYRTISGFENAKNPPKGKFQPKSVLQRKKIITSKRLEIEQNYTFGSNRKPISGYRLVTSKLNSDAIILKPKLLPV